MKITRERVDKFLLTEKGFLLVWGIVIILGVTYTFFIGGLK